VTVLHSIISGETCAQAGPNHCKATLSVPKFQILEFASGHVPCRWFHMILVCSVLVTGLICKTS